MNKKHILCFVLIFTASLWSQNITNTLGANGLFYVKDASSNSLFTVTSSGNSTLNGTLTLTNGSDSYTLPNTDGSAEQVLKTDGNGNVSWSTPSTVSTESVKFLICVEGTWPGDGNILDHFLGEIIMFAGYSYRIPINFMECKGQLLNTSEYSELFEIIGNAYGGDGISTFALPNFTSKVPEGQ